MRVGMMGMGKLGLPVALAMEQAGHEVYGYDLDHDKLAMYQQGQYPHQETGPDGKGDITTILRRSKLRNSLHTDLKTVVDVADILFVAVETPHAPTYEGTTRMPAERRDFDYSFLENAIQMIALVVAKPIVICVVSTVLPGTVRRLLLPLVNDYMTLVYNPSFIAMGNTMQDWLYPEFVLLGADQDVPDPVLEFYGYKFPVAPVVQTSLEEAEFIKVVYNTYISTKIVYANTLMEMCHRLDHCDVDVVVDTLGLATRRLISTQYMRGGMGDGGACHPRDLIAMSHLSQRLELSYDLFTDMIRAREAQAGWLADLMQEYNLPKIILGTAFKRGSSIKTGSAALLVKSILESRKERVITHDPHVRETTGIVFDPAVFLIGCNHPDWETWHFPKGSVVIDPWRYIPDRDGITVIRVGES